MIFMREQLRDRNVECDRRPRARAFAFGGDAAVFQHVTVMSDAQHLARVLLGDEDGRAAGIDPSDDIEDEVECLGRKPERRLVHQKATRPRHQRAPDRQHLLLAAGQKRRRLPLTFAQDRKQRKHLLHARLFGLSRHQIGAHFEILAHAHLAEQMPALRHLNQAARHEFGRRPTA